MLNPQYYFRKGVDSEGQPLFILEACKYRLKVRLPKFCSLYRKVIGNAIFDDGLKTVLTRTQGFGRIEFYPSLERGFVVLIVVTDYPVTSYHVKRIKAFVKETMIDFKQQIMSNIYNLLKSDEPVKERFENYSIFIEEETLRIRYIPSRQ